MQNILVFPGFKRTGTGVTAGAVAGVVTVGRLLTADVAVTLLSLNLTKYNRGRTAGRMASSTFMAVRNRSLVGPSNAGLFVVNAGLNG